jgi:hypothetical protein
MANHNPSPDVIRRLVGTAWSADTVPTDPDDPRVRGFAEFGLPPDSPLVTGDQLRDLEVWRDSLRIPANSAFLDGTLLLTVKALLGPDGPDVLTPVTLWELTAFIDALVSFDRLYCIANPVVDVSFFNKQLGSDVLTAIPDPNGGMLRTLAAQSAADGVLNMEGLRGCVEAPDAFGQEVQAVVDGWRAVLGPDLPGDGPFDIRRLDIGLAELTDRLPKHLKQLSRRSTRRRSHPAWASASVALGVVAQTGIVPLAPALKAGVDAAQGLSRNGSWARIWRRLFHRHEYFLTQTNSQAIALTDALPQLQQLWEMPKIGGYLQRFASATQQMGYVLRG